MKVVLIVGIVLFAIVGVVFVIGLLIPRDHVASSSITLRQPRDTVWRAVRDLSGVTSWWTAVASSQRSQDSAGREVWDQKMKNGFVMRFIVTEDKPPERLVMAIDAPATAPFGGTWTYEVAAADGGSRVTVTERGYINTAPFRFMARFIFGYHGTMDGYLKAMGKKFGEDVQPSHGSPGPT